MGVTPATFVRSAVLAAFAALPMGCAQQATGPSVVFETQSAGIVRYRIELAESDEARERGLMGRTSLDEDAGMLFVWPQDSASAFWMKDTPMRLSIAFISAGGEVLRVFDMEPCLADPCPVYDPHASYRMALEVRQGELERRGVRVGDHARLIR